MKARSWGKLAMAAVIAAAGGSAGYVHSLRAAPGGTTATPEASSGVASLQAFSAASQELYKQVSGSLVRVKLDQDATVLVPAGLREDFAKWRESNKDQMGPVPDGNGPRIEIVPKDGRPPEKAGPGDKPDHPEGPPHRGPARGGRDAGAPVGKGPAATGAGWRGPGNPAGANLWAALRFLQERNQQGGVTDPEIGARLRMLRQRVDAARNGQPSEETAVLLDNEGHALLLQALPKDITATTPLNVTLADGSETTATVVSSDAIRNISILKVEKAPTGVARSETRPAPGEMLMCVTAGQGAMGWIIAPMPGGRRGEGRFPVFGDERGPAYFFNVNGQLAAITVEHHGLAVAGIRAELDALLRGESPRRIGVSFRGVPANSPLRESNKLLGNRPAVQFDTIAPGSPAEKLGLQKGDILVAIDKKPVTPWNLAQDLAGRTSGTVSLTILRDEKEVVVDVPLDRPQGQQ